MELVIDEPHVLQTPGSTAGISLSLALTLSARLCHEIAGTLGAMSGLLDMVEEQPDAEALSLAASCGRELTARLRLLRAAWGNDDIPALDDLVAGLPGIDRLNVDLSGIGVGLDAGLHRLAPNLLMLAASALPRGGAIRLSGSPSLVLEIEGRQAGWPAALAGCLDGGAGAEAAAQNARDVGTAVTCLLASHLGIRLVCDGPRRLEATLAPRRLEATLAPCRLEATLAS